MVTLRISCQPPRQPPPGSTSHWQDQVKTIPITEANSMDIHRVGTYLIPLRSWRWAEHLPVDRIGIGHLAVEESSIELSGRQESAGKD
jgi:hypothetical protein